MCDDDDACFNCIYLTCKFLHFANVQHSTNPPAAPSPTQPIAKPVYYADLCHTDIHKHACTWCAHVSIRISIYVHHDDPADDDIQVVQVIYYN